MFNKDSFFTMIVFTEVQNVMYKIYTKCYEPSEKGAVNS